MRGLEDKDMKTFKFLATSLFVAVFGLALTACNSDDDKDKVTSQLPEVIQFSNATATLHQGSIPAVTDRSIEVTASSNSSALAGGANIMTINSPVPLKKFFVGVEGVDGYYEVVPEAARATRADGEYTYVLTLNYGTELAQDLTIVITAQTMDDLIVAVARQVVEYVESKDGALAINLVFDQLKDVDLHLFLPESSPFSWIYYGNRGWANDESTWEQKYSDLMTELMKKYGYNQSTPQENYSEAFWLEFEQRMRELEEF